MLFDTLYLRAVRWALTKVHDKNFPHYRCFTGMGFRWKIL